MRAFAFSSVGWTLRAISLGTVLLLAGCTRDLHFQPVSMWNESRLRPLQESPFREGGSSSLPLVPGSVARGELPADDPTNTGRSGNKLVTKIPFAITPAVLARGQERFNIYCSPCHGRLGNGDGMIPKRGFPHPPDYKIARLRTSPVGHFYDVITNGYGAMYSYASRVPINDRWSIAAYIRVLQEINRPIIPESQWKAERVKARETGIGTRPVKS